MAFNKKRQEIYMALSEYVSSSSDVYERIAKLNNPETYLEVSKNLSFMDIEQEQLNEEVKDVWDSMQKEAFCAW